MRLVHPDVMEALETIDAALFSGDTFQCYEGVSLLEKYLHRWQRELVNITNYLEEEENDD